MYPLRIATINLCAENPIDPNILIKKWGILLCKYKIDILFIQEISTYNIEKFASYLGMKMLHINNFDGTCVFINPNKLSIVDNNHITLTKQESSKSATGDPLRLHSKPIYIGGLHLDDIPSLSHHMNNMVYNSSEIIPLSYTMPQLLKLCKERRLPRLNEELKNIKETDIAIIAGDFNEPSHVDLDKHIKIPISTELVKKGFIDTYRHINKDSPGYTWPTGNFYKDEPDQRIDFIYTKNIKIVGSETVGTGAKWLSDHKMLITDIVI